LQIRGNLASDYADIYTPAALDALKSLAALDPDRKTLMAARLARREERSRSGRRIEFLDPDALIGRTSMPVRDARAGDFEGSEIPHDLERQWIQGTGPAAKPGTTLERSIRNVAYALLSGADGWMFDGEDALGQVSTMSLDNQRNLALALARTPLFLDVAAQVSAEMNAWSLDALGRIRSIREFDDAYTAPFHGFRDAADYYHRASAMQAVDKITIPTLIITAADDPFVPPGPFKEPSLTRNRNITLKLTPHGGHCGFVEEASAGYDGYWAEREIVRFLAEHLR